MEKPILTDTEWELGRELEKQWRMDTAKTQTDEFLVDTFPKEKATLMVNLSKYWDEAAALYVKLHKIRDVVDRQQVDSFSKWFYLKKTRFKEGGELLSLQKRIGRLERLKIVYEKKEIEKQLSKEYFKTKKEREMFDIDRMFARQELLVDIAAFYNISLRPLGKMFKGLCPFHMEKTPSFFIYADNWFHCYGCQAHGNFLDFLMKKNNYTFKEALIEANQFL